MQKNKTNNIVFLKDIESNIIEEAIVILRKNIKLENIEKSDMNENIDILKEAELIINQRISLENYEFEKYKVNKLESKFKKMKIINIILSIALVLLIIF